jgi:hypothetical protein
MSKIIYINFINIDNQNFFKLNNDIVYISLSNESGYNKYRNEYGIRYDYIDNTIIKKYYIETYDLKTDLLTTENFTLEISSFNFIYGYYKDEDSKSLIIYNNNNFYQLIYLGLPNLKNSVNIFVDYNYMQVETDYLLINSEYPDSKSIMMLNNYQGSLNYVQNTIFLDGLIYLIKINSIIDLSDTFNNYKLFKINDSINLDLDTRIYFYNDITSFSYIINLNCYNFSEYKLYPENYETICLLIDYMIEGESNIKYSVILSLNLQTFNSIDLEDETDNKYYYNTLFFKNYVNENYFVNSITMFDYDYDKYFNTNTELHNIINFYYDLYGKIIGNDVNLVEPTIPETNYYSYLLINFDRINLLNLIKINSENNKFEKIMWSSKISLDTIINYLSQFELKLCNVYYIFNHKIINYDYMDTNISNSQSLSYNYNYLYSNSKNILNKNYSNIKINKGIINFDNNIINCVRCKIVFLFNYMGSYSFYGKLFLDNYSIQIYHKNYKVDSDEDKKKLINLLLYIGSVSLGIKIIFYNQIDSEPKVSSFFNYYLNTNPYYLFNEINLSRKLDDYDVYFDIASTDKNYNQQYLKFNINIKLDYYILFFYSDKDSVLANYNELVFVYSQYIFKILKNPITNGNIYENKEVFYIGFNNLKQINLFLIYLNTGLFVTNNNKLSNFFNIPTSVTFCNYYNINNYWVLDSLPVPLVTDGNPNVLLKNKIYFSINNLKINNIYLQGDFYIKEII